MGSENSFYMGNRSLKVAACCGSIYSINITTFKYIKAGVYKFRRLLVREFEMLTLAYNTWWGLGIKRNFCLSYGALNVEISRR